MAERGVTCHRCGASTPLPEDLRTPTFHCAFCGADIATASVAGRAAVSADALIGHVAQAMQSPASALEAARSAPKFEGGDTGAREAPCRRCGATVQVPLDLTVHQLTCASCGATQAVREYISDRERFELDMARQVSGNAALKRLIAEGVACAKCAARNPVPDDGSVQIECRYCRATIVLADHVDASALARNRLKHGVFELRDAARNRQAERERRVNRVVLAVVALVTLGGLVGLGVILATHR